MKKETGISFILIKDNGTNEHIEFPFTIPPNQLEQININKKN